jgi:hypothetical protein
MICVVGHSTDDKNLLKLFYFFYSDFLCSDIHSGTLVLMGCSGICCTLVDRLLTCACP